MYYYSFDSLINFKLSSTKDLLGRSGIDFLLFGMLARDEGGQLCLEDMDGRVRLSLTSEVGAVLRKYLAATEFIRHIRVKDSLQKDALPSSKEPTRMTKCLL